MGNICCKKSYTNPGTLQSCNVKLLEDSVNYLGHTLCKYGVKPNKDKVKAIVEAPAPQNLKQLQAYLGLLNYHNRFLPNLSHALQPMYGLLQKNKKLVWSSGCQKAFDNSKKLMLNNNILEMFDPTILSLLRQMHHRMG